MKRITILAVAAISMASPGVAVAGTKAGKSLLKLDAASTKGLQNALEKVTTKGNGQGAKGILNALGKQKPDSNGT